MERLTIRDVPGIRVGHWTDAEARTGCTVVLAPDAGMVAGVDVRGSAPGTRETDLLRPTALANGSTRSAWPVAPPSGWRPPTVS